MYDYYESRGFLDEKSEEEVEIADDELIEYAVANTRKDGIYKLSEEDITTVVQGELDYCDSLGVFEDWREDEAFVHRIIGDNFQ